MYRLYVKLKAVKAVLKEQNLACFGNLKLRVSQARDNLHLAQKEVLESFGRADSLLKEKECLHAYVSITKAEESFLKQKARNQWLQLGDQNNSFFHCSLKVQHAKKTITHLWDDQGNRVEEVEQIKQVAASFYKKLLGTNQLQFTASKADRVRHLISVAISTDQAALLEKEITADEIKDTLFNMKNNKAPGLDGFPVEFFKSAWSVVGQDFIAAIKDFFVSSKLLTEVNATILSLVPKKVNPSAMGDFRPIACCNVVYKCITKILANRMLLFLSELISMNQSAFIPSKSIAENVLLAQELVRNYHKDRGQPRCTLKIDLMKAYDSVDWEFLICCLQCFGFLTRFINWIRVCITSPRFSVCINGTMVGYFEGKRGLRQGDPLSPYLFVIAMEVFSKIMVDYTGGNSGFKFHPKCASLKLTHLCFADDLLIFSEASLISIKIIKSALLEFESLSGLKSNPTKSSFFCSGISERIKHVLLDDLGMNEGLFPVRYLGVPLISSRLSATDCGALITRITGRIDSWLSRNLSFAGRLQLISSVLYNLQVYWSSIFILPKRVIKDIEQKFNRFLWNGNVAGGAKAKVSWTDVCLPKKEGGLGLKRLNIWNYSSMLRHIWSLFARSGSIWVAWVKENLLKRKSFWSVGVSQNCSWNWRKILKLRDIARRFLRYEVGTGEHIHLWLDWWHPMGVLFEKFGFRMVYDAHSTLEAKLSSVIQNANWCWGPARSEALVEIQAGLYEVRLGSCDKPIWGASRKKRYVCSNTWEALRVKNDEVLWCKLVWFPLAIPKQAFILWLAMRDRLTTGERLLKWGYQGNVKCWFCHNQMETRDHLFFECSFSSRIWNFCMARCRVDIHVVLDDIVRQGCSSWFHKSLKCLICRLVFNSTVYNLWLTINELVHAGQPCTEEQILKKILWEVRA
jgi:hypothetical protein